MKYSAIILLLLSVCLSCQTTLRTFTETEISQLQSKIYEITGDGEVMGLFNEMLGISAG